jgi:hypothetical protein
MYTDGTYSGSRLTAASIRLWDRRTDEYVQRFGSTGGGWKSRLQPTGAETPLPVGGQTFEVEGIGVSFNVPTEGWKGVDDLYVSKDPDGTKGAEAIIYWTTIIGDYAGPCGQWWGNPPGSALDYAVNASDGQAVQRVTQPARTSVGGSPGAHVAFTVRHDVGCGQGFFYRWRPIEGSSWRSTEAGDTVRVWLVDVGETRLFIEGATRPAAGTQLDREIEQIVGSIRFA